MLMRRAALVVAALSTIVTLAMIASPSRAGAKAISGCALFRLSGYTSTDFPGRTRDGTPTIGNEWSILASDPSVVPLGSYVAVDGLGTFRAADTGGGIRGNHLDILVRTRAEAYALTGYADACWS